MFKDVFYLFAPPLFADPSSYSCSGSEGRKMRGRKMRSKRIHQLFCDATWSRIVTYFTHGITNTVAEGINSKNMPIKRSTGVYRNFENVKKPSCSTVADLFPTHGNAGWTR
ncbi:transposase [Pirellulaceae bacterium SH501]